MCENKFSSRYIGQPSVQSTLLLLVLVLLGMARMNQKEEILATRLRMLCYHHSGLALMHSGKATCEWSSMQACIIASIPYYSISWAGRHSNKSYLLMPPLVVLGECKTPVIVSVNL